MRRRKPRSLVRRRRRMGAARMDIPKQKAVRQKAVNQGPAQKPKQKAVRQKAVRQKAVPNLKYRGIGRDYGGRKVKVYTASVGKRRRKKR